MFLNRFLILLFYIFLRFLKEEQKSHSNIKFIFIIVIGFDFIQLNFFRFIIKFIIIIITRIILIKFSFTKELF
jgi:hypothetical protein